MCVYTGVHTCTFGEGELSCQLISHLPVTEQPSRHWVCSNLSTTSGQVLREGCSVLEFNTAQLSFSWCSLGQQEENKVNYRKLQISFLKSCQRGFPGGDSGNEPACQCRRCKRRGFDPWVGKMPWRRAWQPAPVFLPGESHGQKSLVGYSPWGRKESDTTEASETHTHNAT